MAKRKPNGEYVGIVGKIVLYEQDGYGVMRTRPAQRNDSSALIANIRVSFGSVSKTLSKIKKLLDVGFENRTWPTAISINSINRKQLKNTELEDSLRWLQFSGGKLSGADQLSAEMTDDGKIKIGWNGTTPGCLFHENDIIIVLLYSNIDDDFHPFYPNGVTRKDGFAVLDDYKIKSGDKIEVFLAFKVNTRNYKTKGNMNISTSQWVGQIES